MLKLFQGRLHKQEHPPENEADTQDSEKSLIKLQIQEYFSSFSTEKEENVLLALR